MRKGGCETKGATMTITLEVPPHLEARLREYLASGDPADVQGLLAAAFASAIEAILSARERVPLSDAEFEALMDELDNREAGAEVGPAIHPDETFNRESIYGDHP
jgi:hypothetical protein